MGTKIVAARLATAAGVTTIVTRSSKPGNIVSIINHVELLKRSAEHNSTTSKTLIHTVPVVANGTALNEPDLPPLHTRFLPAPNPIRDRYFWLLHGLAPRGTIYIDAGAHAALSNKANLLPIGIVNVEGNFGQQECARLSVLNPRDAPLSKAEEVGRALTNYSTSEVKRIKGRRSSQISEVLGYADSEYVAVRGNVALHAETSRPVTSTPGAAAGSVWEKRASMGRLSNYVVG